MNLQTSEVPSRALIEEQALFKLCLQRVVNGSDASSRFLVEGLTEGTYKFSLTVTNIRGKCASDDVTVKVLPNPHAKNLVSF